LPSSVSTFGVGSAAAEVTAAQGNPEKIEAHDNPYVDDVWYYGGTSYSASTVSLSQDGKVTGWVDNLGILKLHVISINPNGTFGVGSAAAEVTAAQGNPEKIEAHDNPYVDDVWYYGGTSYSASTVSLSQDGKVTGWVDNLEILKLR
jgi:hypothetical protein